MISKQINWIAIVVALGISNGWAQEPAQPADTMPGMDHGQMSHGESSKDKKTDDTNGMGSGAMDHGSMSMQGGAAPPDARDPHAYAEGYGFGPLPRMHMAEDHYLHSFMADRLERASTRDNSSTQYDLRAWFGRDYNRAVLKAEGDVDAGEFQEARTELLWGHALTTYWDTQLGVRYDGGAHASRRWLAFGVQGLAPYWFELEATAYAGDQGRSAFRLAAEYELLLTQRLILQPRVETHFYGKRDPEAALGSGLSDVTAGLRLRYEIRREFAPYVGWERQAKFGGSADFARAAGQRTRETRVVAGLRFWF